MMETIAGSRRRDVINYYVLCSRYGWPPEPPGHWKHTLDLTPLAIENRFEWARDHAFGERPWTVWVEPNGLEFFFVGRERMQDCATAIPVVVDGSERVFRRLDSEYLEELREIWRGKSGPALEAFGGLKNRGAILWPK